jgi:hypothetical protein
MRNNTAEVTGGKPIAISGVSVVGPLAAFYDINRRKGEVPLYSSVPDTTWETNTIIYTG